MKFTNKALLAVLALLLTVSLLLVGCDLAAPSVDTTDDTVTTAVESVLDGTDPETDPETNPETDPESQAPDTDPVTTDTPEEPTEEPTQDSAEDPTEEPTEEPDDPAEPEVPALSMPSFSSADVPAFEKSPYVEVNGNIPFFTANQITDKSYEYYSPRDSLGRCGIAVASIGRDLMPTSDRGSISSVKPTGWHSVSYPSLGVDSLYNRSHLIAFQLTGENANWENLISGTRFMNQTGMTLFENQVADYIKETGNHVMYRVTPVFTGNNLVADGVLMEAWSVEDEGDGICFCVYLYNVQPGVEIDYATGESELVGIDLPEGSPTYILNTGSKKFHKPTCSNASSISDKNRAESYETREELIAQGYKSAGCCNP